MNDNHSTFELTLSNEIVANMAAIMMCKKKISIIFHSNPKIQLLFFKIIFFTMLLECLDCCSR